MLLTVRHTRRRGFFNPNIHFKRPAPLLCMQCYRAFILIRMEVEIEYGNKCPRCGNEFGIRCIEFQSCYVCNYPYEKEEKVIQEQSESTSDSDNDELSF